MVTQADVAKEAGVSFITVYRVLNNKGYVKKETREKVLETVKRLNYYTNHIGKALRKQVVNTIGIVIPEPPNIPVHGMEYYNMLLQGVDRFTALSNYDLLLSTYKQDNADVDYFRLYFQRKVDGLILFIPDMRHFSVTRIVQKKIPCVIIGERPDHSRVSYVDADNYQGMERLSEYLLSRGLKKFILIKGKSHMRNSIDREKGFLDTMKKAGIDIPPGNIIEGDYSIKAGAEAMKKIIASQSLPDAVVCSNDHMAIGVLTEARKAGIRIPDDMSLAGFDDINITGLIDPPLSTVRQPLFDMGYTATEILFEKIRNPLAKTRKVVLPVELVIRKSIA